MISWIVVLTSLIYLSEGQPCDDVTPCPEGFTCHPAQNICYTDPPQTSKLHVWLGEGPDECIRQPDDCNNFMMDYDTSHVYGGLGEWCNTGVKIRCVVKDAPPLNPPTPPNELRVIAYNIFERGFYITVDGQVERTCRIPHVFAASYPDVDVITFQECFMGGCWPKHNVSIRHLLTHIGFPYFTKTIRSPTKIENGGIFVASRWPIIEEDQYVFISADVPSWDMFSAKGVSYAKIQKESYIYHVMSTHFQAGSSETKFNQSVEWAEFVTSKNIPETEAVIYSGDFNSNFYDPPGDHFWQVMDNLDAGMPELVGPLNATANPVVNDLLQLKGRSDWGSWIDHAVYKKSNLVPLSAINEILRPIDENPISVCWCEECVNPLRWSYTYPNDEECPGTVEYIQDLSDHQPVLGEFIFP